MRRLAMTFPVLLTALLCYAPASWACTVLPPQAYEPPADTGSDGVWPEAPAVDVVVTRGSGPDSSGCLGEQTDSCADIGVVSLFVSTRDNTAAAEEIGYLLLLDSGELPEGFVLPDYPVAPTEDLIALHWPDGSGDDQEAITFTLSVMAVDPAGNVGPATRVVVRDDGEGAGCNILPARGSGSTSWLLVTIAVLGLAGLRRRRARRNRPAARPRSGPSHGRGTPDVPNDL